MATDPVEGLVEGWKRELPDVETAPMATVARLNRLSGLLNRRVADALDERGSSLGEFDVLSALRRQGPPYELMPSELSRRVMLSPSGMTHRIDLLQEAGLVNRRLDPSNRRSMPVALTAAGIEAAEALVRLVVDLETRLLQPLGAKQTASLDGAASALLEHLDG